MRLSIVDSTSLSNSLEFEEAMNGCSQGKFHYDAAAADTYSCNRLLLNHILLM